jgi:hypothetical protein
MFQKCWYDRYLVCSQKPKIWKNVGVEDHRHFWLYHKIEREKKTLADSQFLVTCFGFLLSKNGHPRVRPTCKTFNAVTALCFTSRFLFCGCVF